MLHLNAHFLLTGRKTSVVRSSAGAKRCVMDNGWLLPADDLKEDISALKVFHFRLDREEELCDVSSSSRNQYFNVRRGEKCYLCFTSRLEILGLVQDHFFPAVESLISMSRSSPQHLNTFHREHHSIIIYHISSSPVPAARQTRAVKCFPLKEL